mgnify:CR=1 FL=1
MSPQVMEHALGEDELMLGGRRQDVAVLFSDLRGFTAGRCGYAPVVDGEGRQRHLAPVLRLLQRRWNGSSPPRAAAAGSWAPAWPCSRAAQCNLCCPA